MDEYHTQARTGTDLTTTIRRCTTGKPAVLLLNQHAGKSFYSTTATDRLCYTITSASALIRYLWPRLPLCAVSDLLPLLLVLLLLLLLVRLFYKKKKKRRRISNVHHSTIMQI